MIWCFKYSYFLAFIGILLWFCFSVCCWLIFSDLKKTVVALAKTNTLILGTFPKVQWQYINPNLNLINWTLVVQFIFYSINKSFHKWFICTHMKRLTANRDCWLSLSERAIRNVWNPSHWNTDTLTGHYTQRSRVVT